MLEAHLGAFEYDWRTRFHTRLDVPGGMSWGEAWRLTQELIMDPSSHVAAAVAGWANPVSREWLVAADAYDALIAINTSKGQPTTYPRPWDKPEHAYGAGTSLSIAEFRALRDAITERG